MSGRPMGIILYGKSGVGKSSWRKDLERILKEKVRCVNSLKSIADKYERETIIVLDEFKGSDFRRYAKELKLMITEDQCETLPYKKVVDLAWPRRIMICTNEDIREWKFNEAIEERLLIVRTKEDGSYQYQKYERGELRDLEIEEVRKKLGIK